MNTKIKSVKTKFEDVAILINDDQTNMLSIDFNGREINSKLFLPKLKYIKFVKTGGKLFVYLNDLTILKYFDELTGNFIDSLTNFDNTEILVEKFNKYLKDLIRIGERDKKLSINTAKGLYGELFYLKESLLKGKQESVIEAWHRPSFANHDFVFQNSSVEIKTISKNNTTIKIASEYQLECIENKQLFLKCYIVDDIIQSSIDSLGIIYDEILNMLESNTLKEIFVSKCSEDVTGYLGPDLMQLDYYFILIDTLTYLVDQKSFPRIKRNEMSPFINNISYNIDISSLKPFMI